MNFKEVYNQDIDELSKLYVRVYTGQPWNEKWELEWAVSRLRNLISSPGFMGLKLIEGSEVKAAILAKEEEYLGRKELFITELFVDIPNQRMGIGKKLLSALESKAKKEGYSYCTLLTSRDMGPYDFYTKYGFSPKDDVVFMVHKL